MNMLAVEIDKKSYPNGTCAIDGLKFSAQQGEFVAIVGPSGSGKTTLLNIVAGIDQQVEGNIVLNGQSQLPVASTTKPTTKYQAADIGFMFQESRLMPWLTVKQNIQMVMDKEQGVETPYLSQLLEQVGLAEFADNYPKQLSGGMKRRASLVRAFINRPPLLLMDEPFQSLDEPTANTLRQILLVLWKETRPTVLFVTHTLREALALADRVIFLSDRPSRVIMEYRVDIPRPRKLEDDAINDLHARLLNEYPQLLSGSLAGSPSDSAQASTETEIKI
ncbi:MAG: ABC transporter [uncultured Thiotrichaceae bacterium]|uniref:ABC transporter n=1 Tax=uncultured Thiotrichaceae bacterium TaxID=298394 RepID=A0A6S6TNV6_9GAMM|nr:MAG: ABC transporter [uncultured Thiotrichaceae bacterium]